MQINPYPAGQHGLCVCLAWKNAKLKSCQGESNHEFASKAPIASRSHQEHASIVVLTITFLHSRLSGNLSLQISQMFFIERPTGLSSCKPKNEFGYGKAPPGYSTAL